MFVVLHRSYDDDENQHGKEAAYRASEHHHVVLAYAGIEEDAVMI